MCLHHYGCLVIWPLPSHQRIKGILIKILGYVIVVQPTGLEKIILFYLPALLSPVKVSFVIEPAVTIILNQVETLHHKGIELWACGGDKRVANNKHCLFKKCNNLPQIVVYTSEYAPFWIRLFWSLFNVSQNYFWARVICFV